jgi:O-antigen/teichoic acid export membrane protein
MLNKGIREVKALIASVKNPSAFLKNILAVFTASTISQFIPIVTAPILTRIYSPEDYGFLGIIMSITGLFSVFATMGYANAIITADTEEETNKVVGLCLKSLLAVTCISCLGIFIFHNFIATIYSINKNKYLLYLVPISILLNGIASIFGLLATRYQHFKMLSINRVLSAILSAVVSIAFGLILKNLLGLIIGFLISQLFGSIVLYIALIRIKKLPTLLQYTKLKTKSIAIKFQDFPKYVLPSDFINNFSNQIPIFVLSSYAMLPQVAVGFYNMSNRILALPISLISNSISDVFKQRAASDYNEFGTCRPIFMKTFKALFISSLIPFAILIFFGADIFAFAFGEKWREAGAYSQILGIMFFFRFIVSPLSYVFYVAGKQKQDFILHLLFIVLGFLSLYIGLKQYNSVNTSLWLFSLSYSSIYFIYFIYSYHYSIKK